MDLKIFTNRKELSEYLDPLKKAGKIIGFAPTMGALHNGHLSLIKEARAKSDIIVCSIFVNPTQFTHPEDLEKYPRPIKEDIRKLQKSKCDVLFLPAIQEMYPGKENWYIDLGEVEGVLEGKYRPGHYQGVTQIVKKLFDIVNPDLVFLGQKDFQQFLIIHKMVQIFNLPIKLVLCPTIREKDGLAMSSRNIHLSDIQRKQALKLSEVLELTQQNFKKKPIEQLKIEGMAFLNNSEGIKPEYFEICDMEDLKPAVSKDIENLIVLVAAHVGNTRLIDNLISK